MYLWNVDRLIEDVKKEQVSSLAQGVYFIVDPLLTVLSIVLFSVVLILYKVVAGEFSRLLPQPDTNMGIYNNVVLGLGILTTAITVLGLVYCYIVNKRGDGKAFFNRLSSLGCVFNMHIILYLCFLLVAVTAALYFYVKIKIHGFTHNLVPAEGSTLLDLAHNLARGTSLEAATEKASQSSGFLASLLTTPVQALALPLIPAKALEIAQAIRSIVLAWMLFLAVAVPCLNFYYYKMLAHAFRRVSQP